MVRMDGSRSFSSANSSSACSSLKEMRDNTTMVERVVALISAKLAKDSLLIGQWLVTQHCKQSRRKSLRSTITIALAKSERVDCNPVSSAVLFTLPVPWQGISATLGNLEFSFPNIVDLHILSKP